MNSGWTEFLVLPTCTQSKFSEDVCLD
ncbi:TPA_asm: hypothetical protein HUJ06_031785 [Nelumbo nucifera]|uniref:Uncharacterized protein n=1 Tax=Nelumbo nucifera TaxID=4432 RepID=A0A822XRQ4_NELNU|nr:TPA_asm: hypothetical protein HUJ06_022927 [Nelumbo nucifera]DAD21465.1 TPA_asm: hypothetical protein HUJ06_022928 [Nelumbo nucifera]DAD49527.1 TPA_asm: hypothetical protein HUJ06_031785 [Nelumbo nucifera]